MKKAYKTPNIKTVVLDKDISLQLESDPYSGPEKVRGNDSQGARRSDPYQYDEW